MKVRSKKYKEALSAVNPKKSYTVDESIEILANIQKTSFDSTLEGHFAVSYKNLQNVRGNIQLPHGTGKKVRVLVFAKADKAKEAESSGADYVGDEDLIQKVKDGWLEFDAVVATPDMMKEVGKLGPILGKKGLMPKPKSGTVTLEVASIIKQLKSGRIDFKPDKTGIIHLSLGKFSFSKEKLIENSIASFNSIMRQKPVDAKGDYITSMYLVGTMSPSVKINIKELRK